MCWMKKDESQSEVSKERKKLNEVCLYSNLSRKLRLSGEPHKMNYTFFQAIFNSDMVTKLSLERG